MQFALGQVFTVQATVRRASFCGVGGGTALAAICGRRAHPSVLLTLQSDWLALPVGGVNSTM